MFDCAIFIGRFQPFHTAHLKELHRSLEIAKQVIVVIGSHRRALSPKNPFTAPQRQSMIEGCLAPSELLRVKFIWQEDFIYNDTQWLFSLVNQVDRILGELPANPKICITGCNKDASSSYLGMLPDSWARELSHVPTKNIHATKLREEIFTKPLAKVRHLTSGTHKFLKDFVHTTSFHFLKSEHEHYVDYRKIYEGLPYPPIFVTTDALVIKNGHVLIVRRKNNPGKGQLALPGGFIKADEKILDSAVRELKEETKIEVSKDFLKNALTETKVFDDPSRSLRGRTISHGHCFKLPDGGALPRVQGGDDAAEAFWASLVEAYRLSEEFFEDHFDMLNYFTRKY